jgi:hypothetical protein
MSLDEVRRQEFESFWSRNYAVAFKDLPGILQSAWKEVAKKSWDEAWELCKEELG